MIQTRRLLVIATTAFALAGSVSGAGAQTAKGATKVDQALTEAMRSSAGTHRVIITAKPGYRASLRKTLQQHGDWIKAEHASLDVLVSDLDALPIEERWRQHDAALRLILQLQKAKLAHDARLQPVDR